MGMKILIACPTHIVKSYCDKVFYNAVNNLKVDGQEIVIRYDPNEYGKQDSCKLQREWFRKYAVDNNFDYIYFMGHDNPATTDQINKLLSHNLPLVSGVYWGRHNANNGTPEGCVCGIHGKSVEENREIFKKPNQLVKSSWSGMDAILISRDVFTKVSYMDWLVNDDDYPFCDKAKEKGFDLYIDTDVQLPHFYSENGFSYLGKRYEDGILQE